MGEYATSNSENLIYYTYSHNKNGASRINELRDKQSAAHKVLVIPDFDKNFISFP
ncbi:hypothetical protein PAECIP111891_07038 [Paenibacillus allorhizoplanae]|uniref:Uncharacterized protein n=1 Tax=Paenibacillus allorhizoplanae TaxID=2905648 RepID=A0ABM9CZ96_9BACL|nr:hypothetical protein PAECIP111891_07038 [Paenibacillus allorhizoplanae]